MSAAIRAEVTVASDDDCRAADSSNEIERGSRGQLQNFALAEAGPERVKGSLGAACARTGWRVHAFVLMSNHYHLLIETPKPNLVAGMRWFQTTYTVRFNRRHRVSGHLFQGRYKAQLMAPLVGPYNLINGFNSLK